MHKVVFLMRLQMCIAQSPQLYTGEVHAVHVHARREEDKCFWVHSASIGLQEHVFVGVSVQFVPFATESIAWHQHLPGALAESGGKRVQ